MISASPRPASVSGYKAFFRLRGRGMTNGRPSDARPSPCVAHNVLRGRPGRGQLAAQRRARAELDRRQFDQLVHAGQLEPGGDSDGLDRRHHRRQQRRSRGDQRRRRRRQGRDGRLDPARGAGRDRCRGAVGRRRRPDHRRLQQRQSHRRSRRQRHRRIGLLRGARQRSGWIGQRHRHRCRLAVRHPPTLPVRRPLERQLHRQQWRQPDGHRLHRHRRRQHPVLGQPDSDRIGHAADHARNPGG